MSSKHYSRAQKLWFLGAFKTICKIRSDEIVNIDRSEHGWEKKVFFLKWRVGLNMYKAGQFFEAMGVLEIICANGEKGMQKRNNGEESLHSDYYVHLTAARCSVELFLATSNHYHLENAYRHYQNSVETLRLDMMTMFRLPMILFEYGHMLEYFGAFQAAIDLYSRILANFPNYRGYFDAMYRSAIVGKHIAFLLDKQSEKDETLNKCIDILQFLLEALPSSINDLHIIVAYGKALEMSGNPSVRFRAVGVNQALFDYCRHQKPELIGNFISFRDWADDPSVWLKLGTIIKNENEPLIAKDAYENYVNRLEIRKLPGKTLASSMEVDISLSIARNFASFQNYDLAVKFGEIALERDHFHKETRTLLSKWSKIYETSLQKEVDAVGAISVNWKGRCWSNGYRKKLKNMIVQDLESRISKNRYDSEARNQLQYYARDKWRSTFLFEEQCAIRIQRKFRQCRKLWVWQAAQRARYLNLASEAFRLYNRRPRDLDVRAEIRRITNHRMCPPKHAIRRARLRIDEEDRAVNRIAKCFVAFRLRKFIDRLIVKRRLWTFNQLVSRVTTVQSCWRKVLAIRKRLQLLKRIELETKSATIIQRYIRWRNSTFQHSVTRIVRMINIRKKWALDVFRFVFVYYHRKFRYRMMHYDEIKKIEFAREQERLRRLAQEKLFLDSVIRVQKFYRRQMSYRLRRIVTKMLKARRSAVISSENQKVILMVENEDAVPSKIRYHAPGIRQNSAPFASLLIQPLVFCDNQFGDADCIMFSNVLRHSNCQIQKLVLYDIQEGQSSSFEFDLLAAISKCRSLRSIIILKGKYNIGFLCGLHYQVQVENPRIKEISIESIESIRVENANYLKRNVLPTSQPSMLKSFDILPEVNTVELNNMEGKSDLPPLQLNDTAASSNESPASLLAASMGRLMMDYFNYSLPGIQSLSIHGCKLRDEELSLICTGISVNSSLRRLVLSLNNLTDEGFHALFQALLGNRKSSLILLDLSWNLIRLNAANRELIKQYVHPQEKTLKLLLLFNLVYYPVELNTNYRRMEPDIEVVTAIVPTKLSTGTVSSMPMNSSSTPTPSKKSRKRLSRKL